MLLGVLLLWALRAVPAIKPPQNIYEVFQIPGRYVILLSDLVQILRHIFIPEGVLNSAQLLFLDRFGILGVRHLCQASKWAGEV